MILAGLKRKLTKETLSDTCQQTISTTSMVFFILIGASIFSLVFRGFGGEEMVQNVFASFPGGSLGSVSDSHACHFPIGLHSGFYRNYFRRCPYCRSSANGHGSRSHLVGDTYRCESADIFSHATIWFCLILSSRRCSQFD